MGMKIRFDTTNRPENPTLILATKTGKKLGLIVASGISIKDSMKDATEITFNVNKYLNGKKNHLWNKIKDFRLAWWQEQDIWFQLRVELDESNETVKTVYCTRLGQAELSQIQLYTIEINTEDDIARDDYKIPTVLYREKNPEASLLHRVLEKAPHYKITHVDSTIANIQRTFSFDGVSIYDALQQIAEEIGCLFVFDSASDENGNILRTIAVYDLESNCNQCGYRGEFTGSCPKCKSTNISEGYGIDTSIFISSDECGADIQFTTDTDSVKNCFKLEAGDDLMTATIRNCNPNGTDYIWYFSDDVKEDMSNELLEKIESYNTLYQTYQSDYVASIDSSYISQYNTLVKKYQKYNSDLQEVSIPIKGYSALMTAYYDTVDMGGYLKSMLMPDSKMGDTTAVEQAKLLTVANISPVAVSDISNISVATADNVVLAMAKIVVDSRYRVKVNTSSLSSERWNQVWTGNFVVTNYSDEEDTATSDTISIVVNDDYKTYVQQKIDKSLNKGNTEDVSISGIFKKEYNDFCSELKKYCFDTLNSFHDACQSCIDILIEQGVADSKTWSGKTPNLYSDLYTPYFNKLKAIEAEMSVRKKEIDSILGVYDENSVLKIDGFQTLLLKEKNKIQDTLDFQKYLGENLWLEFCSFRRDDKYSNDNYVSDGLNNVELFKKALEFIEVANKEIYKSAELQHSISVSLKNILTIEKFKPLREHFEVGNWIRVQVDDTVYKLRLLEYEIDFDNFENLSSVQFSDVTKIPSGITDIQNVLSKASSMATSYDSVKKQAAQGENSNNVLKSWFENGLDATNTKIVGGADNQTQTWDEHGMLFRRYNDVTDSYDKIQLKIINSTLAITDDDWETTKTAIGNFYYNDPITGELKNAYGINAEVVVGRLLLGKELGIYNESGNLTFDNDGFQVTNGIDTVSINPNASSIFNIKNKDGNVLSFDKSGNLVVVGEITATKLTLLDNIEINAEHISGLSDVAFSGEYSDLLNPPSLSDLAGNKTILFTEDVIISSSETKNGITKQKITVGERSFDLINAGDFILLGQKYGTDTTDGSQSYTYISSKGLLTAKNALIYGTVYATNGEFSGKIVADSGIIAGLNIESDSLKSGAITIYSGNSLNGAYINLGNSQDYPRSICSIHGTGLLFQDKNSDIAYGALRTQNYYNSSYTSVIGMCLALSLGRLQYSNNSESETIYLDGSTGRIDYISLNQTSDERVKNILEFSKDDYDNVLMELQPITYTWKENFDNDIHSGLGAQTTKRVLEKYNLNNSAIVKYDKQHDRYSMNYGELHCLEIIAIQKNRELIQNLQNQIKALKG